MNTPGPSLKGARSRVAVKIMRAAAWGGSLAIGTGAYWWVQGVTRESEGLWMAVLIIVAFCVPAVAGLAAALWAGAAVLEGLRHAEIRTAVLGWMAQVGALALLAGWMLAHELPAVAAYLISTGVALAVGAVFTGLTARSGPQAQQDPA